MVSNTTDQERDQRIEELRQALTVRQEKFCQGVLSGMSQAEAYRKAYPRAKRSIEGSAARLAKYARVCEYLKAVRSQRAMKEAQERAEEAQERVLTRQRKREILHGIAENEKHPPNSRIQAVTVDNAMTGDNEPVRVEFTLSGIVSALRGTTDLPASEARNVKVCEENVKVCEENVKVCSNNGNGHNGNGKHNGE